MSDKFEFLLKDFKLFLYRLEQALNSSKVEEKDREKILKDGNHVFDYHKNKGKN